VQQLPAVIYSASAVERATEVCLRLDYDTNDPPRNWYIPLVLFLLSQSPVKSASVNPMRLSLVCLSYHNPRLRVPLIYHRILLSAIRWDSLEFA
jgi:hypothetical protein